MSQKPFKNSRQIVQTARRGRPGKQAPLLFLKGAALGISAVLPGLSGGTMAFVLGIYQKLIGEISKFQAGHARELFFLPMLLFKLFFKTRRAAAKRGLARLGGIYEAGFWLPLLGGAALSLTMFAAFIPPLAKAHPLEFSSLVFGLVLASLAAPLKEMKKQAKTAFLFLASAAGAFLLFCWTGSFMEGDEALRLGGPLWIWLAPAGFLAAMAMMIPGLSGAYLLILLGLYHPMLEALRSLDPAALILFALGGIFGAAWMARWINALLKAFFHEAMAALSGLILGSLYAVWPFPGKSPLILLSPGPEQLAFFIWFGCAFAAALAIILLSWTVMRRAAQKNPQSLT